MYRIKLTAKAKKELKKIAQLHLLALTTIFEELKEDPYLGKPLSRELIKRYSYRVGFYRIIYKIRKKDRIILIITAGHRATVYK